MTIAAQAASPALSWGQLLFSLTGRVKRFDYWVRYFVPWFVGFFIARVVDAMILGDRELGPVAALFILGTLWCSFAVAYKRCHDRNRSAWFLLLLLVPLANLWVAIELGFLPGTVGPNRFGPDPLQTP